MTNAIIIDRVVTRDLHISGKGRVLVVDSTLVYESGFVVNYKDDNYEVTGVELRSSTPNIQGLIVRKLKAEDRYQETFEGWLNTTVPNPDYIEGIDEPYEAMITMNQWFGYDGLYSGHQESLKEVWNYQQEKINELRGERQ